MTETEEVVAEGGMTETEEAVAEGLLLLKGLGEMKESVKETAEKDKVVPEGKEGRKEK